MALCVKKEFMELNKAIGIAKSFSRKVVFMGGGKPKSISHLSKMKKWERSKIYRYRIVGENKESEHIGFYEVKGEIVVRKIE